MSTTVYLFMDTLFNLITALYAIVVNKYWENLFFSKISTQYDQ